MIGLTGAGGFGAVKPPTLTGAKTQKWYEM